jgi:hypothetical protein
MLVAVYERTDFHPPRRFRPFHRLDLEVASYNQATEAFHTCNAC